MKFFFHLWVVCLIDLRTVVSLIFNRSLDFPLITSLWGPKRPKKERFQSDFFFFVIVLDFGEEDESLLSQLGA